MLFRVTTTHYILKFKLDKVLHVFNLALVIHVRTVFILSQW